MRRFDVYLNLKEGTTALPAEFYFHSVNVEEFKDGETAHFIDNPTKLNGHRVVKLFRRVEDGHQHTFFAYLPELA